jgi:2-polyprenyl-6-hydroxyphenyl methylase/3-demethylubiquinone-9 3-methyltransferase
VYPGAQGATDHNDCANNDCLVEEAQSEKIELDPARTAIGVAKRQAMEAGVTVEYRCDTIEALAKAGETFDVVLAMEVIEHVAHSDDFLDRCTELVRPGGLVILSTINRTWKSYVYAI